VFPLQPGGKKPLFKGWPEKATDDPAVIKRWWAKWPDANVAVLCSSTTGPIVVDVDGATGVDALRELETHHGRLPRTLEATSGRPNRKHYYYDANGGPVARRIKPITTENDVPVALDVLGDGGYVVAAPSRVAGRVYAWLNARAPAPFPDRVRQLLCGERTRAASVTPGAIIPEGARNDTLTSLAGTMRRRGFGVEAIAEALLLENADRCQPPMTDEEVRRIARGMARYAPHPIADDLPLTDINLARRFARIERDGLRFCPQWKKWLAWNGTCWGLDQLLEVDRRVEEMVRGLIEQIAGASIDDKEKQKLLKDAAAFTRHHRLIDVLEEARKRLVITPDKLDADPWLLNVRNGTLDLRSAMVSADGRLRVKLLPPDPHRLITKLAPVAFDPAAPAPLWHGFLTAVTQEDRRVEAYLQRAVGYSLLGLVREQILCFCFGQGGTGKTTFQETVLTLFGDYGVTIDFETLLYSRFGMTSDARRDLPRLHRARYVQAKEPIEGGRWNEALVKDLTGGDTMNGRWLYGEKFDFQPSCTLWCRGNSQPESHDASDALWQRMRLFPFEQVFRGTDDEDPELREKLRDELPGILNWALVGLAHYLRDGLGELPERMEKAIARQQRVTDRVRQFVEVGCTRDAHAWTSSGDLYAAYVRWCRTMDVGIGGITPTAFGMRLGKLKGVQRHKQNGEKGWRGVALRQ
jgi:putative DNA primase/helicase